jgi:hypothetical protein
MMDSRRQCEAAMPVMAASAAAARELAANAVEMRRVAASEARARGGVTCDSNA